MKLLPGVMRYHERDIVRVEMPGPPMSPSMEPLPHQPFYRSSGGRNSRRPGTWLPFDGILPLPNVWFDKSRFCRRTMKGTPLYRYGTLEYKAAGEMLDMLDAAGAIKKKATETTDIHAINRWLGLYK